MEIREGFLEAKEELVQPSAGAQSLAGGSFGSSGALRGPESGLLEGEV
jgi:hypothetical protein